MPGLAILFALTALIYASVGFGGGSSYTALLVLSSTDYQILPLISLACNLVVASGGVWRFAQAGEIPWGRALPLCALSVPLAWVGGTLKVPEALFIGLLGASLFAAGLLLLLSGQKTAQSEAAENPRRAGGREIAIGGGLGLLSGVVGIGGGIFLAPILHLTRWAGARAVAGTAALFILLNSIAGMLGQVTKLGGEARLGDAAAYWPLLLAVLVGGQIGSRLGVAILPEIWLRRLTALLVLAVAVRLLLRFFNLLGGS